MVYTFITWFYQVEPAGGKFVFGYPLFENVELKVKMEHSLSKKRTQVKTTTTSRV